MGLVKTVNLPVRKRRMSFSGAEWDMSSAPGGRAVIEQAGSVNRRSESNGTFRAGSLSRRLLSLFVIMTKRRIPERSIL